MLFLENHLHMNKQLADKILSYIKMPLISKAEIFEKKLKKDIKNIDEFYISLKNDYFVKAPTTVHTLYYCIMKYPEIVINRFYEYIYCMFETISDNYNNDYTCLKLIITQIKKIINATPFLLYSFGGTLYIEYECRYDLIKFLMQCCFDSYYSGIYSKYIDIIQDLLYWCLMNDYFDIPYVLEQYYETSSNFDFYIYNFYDCAWKNEFNKKFTTELLKKYKIKMTSDDCKMRPIIKLIENCDDLSNFINQPISLFNANNLKPIFKTLVDKRKTKIIKIIFKKYKQKIKSFDYDGKNILQIVCENRGLTQNIIKMFIRSQLFDTDIKTNEKIKKKVGLL
jgi:hypothetical protein